MAHSISKPLSGVLVVALEQAVAAPYCTSRLADAGARVIKIERESGDFARDYDNVVKGESSYFVWLNRGKESVVLDIKRPKDAKLLKRMLSKADIFVQNLSPGAAERAGFGSVMLRTANPKLITCDISGYSTDGPSRDMKAYDMLVQAETGLASVTGLPGEPCRVGVSVCDIAAGMYSHSAILLALIERKVTGKGQHISCSLFDGMADWMTVPLLHVDYGGSSPKRVGLRHPSVAPYAAFETKDGEKILISIQNSREWSNFCNNVLKTPELEHDMRFRDNISRVENRESLERLIAQKFLSYTSRELVLMLRSFNIAFGKVNSVSDLSNHSDLRKVKVSTSKGTVKIPAPPAKVAKAKSELGNVPALGEHTQAVKNEFS